MDATTELELLLRPAGGGIHMVSTGRVQRLRLQQRIYGVSSEGEIDSKWRRSLRDDLASARVCLLAVPSDTGAGLVRGAAFGPIALRAALLDSMPDFAARARAAGVIDIGDVFVVPQLLHDDMLSDAQAADTRAALFPKLNPGERLALPVSPLSAAERVVAQCLNVNPSLKFMVLGGDHSVAWPVIAALANHRRERFAIVHLDAHTDLLPHRLGVKYCFATWAYHANDVVGRAGRLVQVGIRASGHDRAHWESSLAVRQFWASEVRDRGDVQIQDQILDHLRALDINAVYLSNDIDGTDAGLAPATGAPEPDGLTETFVRALIRRLGAEMPLIAADLVEVAPPVGDAAGSDRTVALGVRYLLDSLAALTGGSNAFSI